MDAGSPREIDVWISQVLHGNPYSPSPVILVLDTGIQSILRKTVWMPDQVRHDFSEGMDAGSPREIDVWISQVLHGNPYFPSPVIPVPDP